MNIYQRLNEVRKAVTYIQKDKTVGTGSWSYKAVTHDMVTASIREHLIEHGVMVVPRVVASQVVLTGTTTGKGVPYIRYEARFVVDFVNCEKPEDKVSVEVDAHAIDEGDKAPGKAVSYATKYAFLKLLSIETGEDDETRVEQKKPPKESEKKDGTTRPAKNQLDADRYYYAEGLERDEIKQAVELARKVKVWLDDGDTRNAVLERENSSLTADQVIFFWTFFDSKERTAMKNEHDKLKAENAEKYKEVA